jgi:hypothetical protein
MHLTDYQAKYFAHELTKRCPSDSLEKLAGALVDAQVDLNPHQVEAALFAFKSPLSKGAIFADEVGLGKTIEAGLVISPKWAERKPTDSPHHPGTSAQAVAPGAAGKVLSPVPHSRIQVLQCREQAGEPTAIPRRGYYYLLIRVRPWKSCRREPHELGPRGDR